MHKSADVKNSLNRDEKPFSLIEENNKSKSTENVEIKKKTQELRPNETQQIKEPEPAYYAVIPANVRYDTRLSPLAKLLYGEITCLCQKEGFCWATNAYFERLYNTSERHIRRIITQLEAYGYVFREIEYDEKTKQVKRRFLRLSCSQRYENRGDENVPTPGDKNVRENNTSINNINIKKVSKKERQLESDKNSPENEKNNSGFISGKKENKKKIKTKPKPSSFDEIIDAYTENGDLRVELREHLKTRKQKKAALTNRALELSLKKLDKLADNDEEKIQIVQNSIINGWVGFFELNEKDKNKLNNHSSYNLDEYVKAMDTFSSEPKKPPERLGLWL